MTSTVRPDQARLFERMPGNYLGSLYSRPSHGYIKFLSVRLLSGTGRAIPEDNGAFSAHQRRPRAYKAANVRMGAVRFGLPRVGTWGIFAYRTAAVSRAASARKPTRGHVSR